MRDDDGTGFAWTAAQLDDQIGPKLLELLVEVRAAQYAQEDLAAARPVRSMARALVDELEYLLGARELRQRAEAGDADAVQQLVDEAAWVELECERLERENEATIAALSQRAKSSQSAGARAGVKRRGGRSVGAGAALP